VTAKAMIRRYPLVRRVFGIPLLLAMATVVGLLAALLGEGHWSAVSWLLLSLPIAVAAWHLRQV
jgi:hypothetical protein